MKVHMVDNADYDIGGNNTIQSSAVITRSNIVS